MILLFDIIILYYILLLSRRLTVLNELLLRLGVEVRYWGCVAGRAMYNNSVHNRLCVQ